MVEGDQDMHASRQFRGHTAQGLCFCCRASRNAFKVSAEKQATSDPPGSGSASAMSDVPCAGACGAAGAWSKGTSCFISKQ